MAAILMPIVGMVALENDTGANPPFSSSGNPARFFAGFGPPERRGARRNNWYIQWKNGDCVTAGFPRFIVPFAGLADSGIKRTIPF